MNINRRQHDNSEGRCRLPGTGEDVACKDFYGQVSDSVETYLLVPTNTDATSRAQRALQALESIANELSKQMRVAISQN